MQNQSLDTSTTAVLEGPARASVQDLDSLAQLSSAQLASLFAGAHAQALQAVNGHPAGRMLAVSGLEQSGVAHGLRALARSPLFVWEGKSFASRPGQTKGRGINRVRLFGRRLLFPFRTEVAASVVDGRPCLAISYDVPENPGPARATYDELREVSPGVFLGRGMRKREGAAPLLLLWFALDTNRPDPDLPFQPMLP